MVECSKYCLTLHSLACALGFVTPAQFPTHISNLWRLGKVPERPVPASITWNLKSTKNMWVGSQFKNQCQVEQQRTMSWLCTITSIQHGLHHPRTGLVGQTSASIISGASYSTQASPGCFKYSLNEVHLLDMIWWKIFQAHQQYWGKMMHYWS